MGVTRIPNRGAKNVRPPQPRPSRVAQPRRIYNGGPRAPLRLQDEILFSILIPTIPERDARLAKLLPLLDAQISRHANVELIVLRDNRSMLIGDKRTKMLELARGRYVAFVDDDDTVAPDYVKSIVERLDVEDPDVLCFLVLVQGHGAPKLCRYHPTLAHANLDIEYQRKPNHLMVWRRELALREKFPSVASGEDTAWAERMLPHINTVAVLNKTLYTYQYDPNDNSLTPRSRS